MMPRPPNEQQALTLFKESNTIIQTRARSFPEGQTHIYISDRDLGGALASRKPFDAVRAKLRIVKILKAGRRPSDGRRAHEHDILQSLARHGRHGNVTDQPESGPQATCYWLTTPYLGPSVKAVIDEQRKYKASHKEWLVLPEMFLWRLIRDTIAGLAYLHAGVPSDYRGHRTAPAGWTSVAHRTSATRITLDIKRTDEHGYPRAILTDFGEASVKPSNLTLGDWMEAKLDLEAVAVDFHLMAHGRKYRNFLDFSTKLWCDCFTTSHVPADSFLKTWDQCIEPSVKLRNFLDSFCNADASHHDEPLTSDQVLAQLNSRDLCAQVTSYPQNTHGSRRTISAGMVPLMQSIFEEPVPGHARLPIQIADLLYGADFTNQDFRDVMPALKDTTGYEVDPHEYFEHQEEDWEWPSGEKGQDDDGDEVMPEVSQGQASRKPKRRIVRLP